MKKILFKKGYSLVEMIVYISILAVILLVVINTILSFTSTYHKLNALRALDRSATDGLERMTRDMRNATGITAGSSTFGTNPGVLTLTTTSGSISTTTKFYIATSTLEVDVNGVNIGPLTTSSVSVTNLKFTQITSTNSTAIKTEMTLSATDGPVTVSKNYYTTTIVKGI